MSATFKKHERLCSQKTIEKLFTEGNPMFVHPFKVLYLHVKEQPFDLQVAIAVPKKKTKRAVKRNYIKRIFRENWRQEKHRLIETLKEHNSKMAVFIVYTGTYEKASFNEFRDKIILILTRLQQEVNTHSESKKNEE
ncbi:MAG: ribonuclease P protein component [Flavobacteriales bacterium]